MEIKKDYQKDYQRLMKLTKEHEKMISESIPLIASENVTSLAVRAFMLSDFQHRYAEGKVGSRVYAGCKYIDEVEKLAIDLAKDVFSAEHVNVQPTSGSVANLAAYIALAKPGEKIASPGIKQGGHITMNRVGIAGKIGLKVVNYSVREDFTIDVEKTAELLKRERPKILMLGASVILFPHPVKELAEICNEVGTHLVYDASHVLGLIAGKEFQDPLKEGAEVVTASTHKTFPGPQHGMILCKKELGEVIDRAVFPGVVSNHHLHCVAALTAALLEMKQFGRDYAKQIVKNAKALAESLHELGFKVIGESKGFTESHQVVVDVLYSGIDGRSAEKMLEKSGIFVNRNLIPADAERGRNFQNPSGIRIGVQEVTRRGMKEGEMKYIAELIHNCLKGKDVSEEVKTLAREYAEIKYSIV